MSAGKDYRHFELRVGLVRQAYSIYTAYPVVWKHVFRKSCKILKNINTHHIFVSVQALCYAAQNEPHLPLICAHQNRKQAMRLKHLFVDIQSWIWPPTIIYFLRKTPSRPCFLVTKSPKGLLERAPVFPCGQKRAILKVRHCEGTPHVKLLC